MRTARSLTVSPSMHCSQGGAWSRGGGCSWGVSHHALRQTPLVPWGVPGPGGVPAPGGVPGWGYTWSQGGGGVPGPGGSTCSWGGGRGHTWSRGEGCVPGPRGGLPGRGYLVWGVYLVPGGCTWSGGCLLLGGCTWSGGVSGTPPREQNDKQVQKILPCPKLRLRTVTIRFL